MTLISLIQKNWLMIYVEYTCFDAKYVDSRRVQYYYCEWWYHLNSFTEADCFRQTIQNVGLDFYVIYVNVTCQ